MYFFLLVSIFVSCNPTKMAIDRRLPVIGPSSTHSSSTRLSAFSSASAAAARERRHPTQVATDNSSTFIEFPTNSRQSSLFIPTYRLRISRSSMRPFSPTTDTQFVLNKAQSLNTSSSSISNENHRRHHSQQRTNPILSNPLLNHRKEQPTFFPTKMLTDLSQDTKFNLSSKPPRPTASNKRILTTRANTNSFSTRPTETNSTRLIALKNNDEQEELSYLDKDKYDYITRWLDEVRQVTYSTSTSSKAKRSKK